MGLDEWILEWQSVRSRGEIKRLGKRIDGNKEERVNPDKEEVG